VGQLLNTFLGSLFTKENTSNIPEAKNRVLDRSMSVSACIHALIDIDFTPKMVASYIKCLKSIKAAGEGGGFRPHF